MFYVYGIGTKNVICPKITSITKIEILGEILSRPSWSINKALRMVAHSRKNQFINQMNKKHRQTMARMWWEEDKDKGNILLLCNVLILLAI